MKIWHVIALLAVTLGLTACGPWSYEGPNTLQESSSSMTSVNDTANKYDSAAEPELVAKFDCATINDYYELGVRDHTAKATSNYKGHSMSVKFSWYPTKLYPINEVVDGIAFIKVTRSSALNSGFIHQGGKVEVQYPVSIEGEGWVQRQSTFKISGIQKTIKAAAKSCR